MNRVISFFDKYVFDKRIWIATTLIISIICCYFIATYGIAAIIPLIRIIEKKEGSGGNPVFVIGMHYRTILIYMILLNYGIRKMSSIGCRNTVAFYIAMSGAFASYGFYEVYNTLLEISGMWGYTLSIGAIVSNLYYVALYLFQNIPLMVSVIEPKTFTQNGGIVWNNNSVYLILGILLMSMVAFILMIWNFQTTFEHELNDMLGFLSKILIATAYYVYFRSWSSNE